jgi:hypothetical protein
MDCQIDWSSSKVEHGKLSVSLKPAPDFAFMLEFDGIVDPLSHPRHVESAGELRTFLDEAVREANRLAADTRAREQEQARAQEAEAAQQEAQRAAAAEAAGARDAQLTDAFRRSG